MKNVFLYKTVVIGWMILALSGCFPDSRTIYDGPLQVEFRPVEYELDLSSETSYSANVQLVGPHQDSAITVRYEIDQEQTTAVRGVHFDIDGDTSQIPANSSFAAIDIQVHPEAFEGDELEVVITLLGDDSGQVRAAQNYKTFTLAIKQ